MKQNLLQSTTVYYNMWLYLKMATYIQSCKCIEIHLRYLSVNVIEVVVNVAKIQSCKCIESLLRTDLNGSFSDNEVSRFKDVSTGPHQHHLKAEKTKAFFQKTQIKERCYETFCGPNEKS